MVSAFLLNAVEPAVTFVTMVNTHKEGITEKKNDPKTVLSRDSFCIEYPATIEGPWVKACLELSKSL